MTHDHSSRLITQNTGQSARPQDAAAEKRLLETARSGPRPMLPQSPRRALQPPFSTALRITSVISQSDVVRLIVWHKARYGAALGRSLFPRGRSVASPLSAATTLPVRCCEKFSPHARSARCRRCLTSLAVARFILFLAAAAGHFPDARHQPPVQPSRGVPDRPLLRRLALQQRQRRGDGPEHAPNHRCVCCDAQRGSLRGCGGGSGDWGAPGESERERPALPVLGALRPPEARWPKHHARPPAEGSPATCTVAFLSARAFLFFRNPSRISFILR